MSLLENINLIFEHQQLTGEDPRNTIEGISRQLAEAQRKVQYLQNQLISMQQELIGALAIKVRQANPAINVSVTKKGCKIGYKTKYLMLYPNIESGIWSVKSQDKRFAAKFEQLMGSQLGIQFDLDLLANAASAYFRQHYKTLGENVIGTGKILIEGNLGTLLELAKWYRSNKPQRLNSRKSRKSRETMGV